MSVVVVTRYFKDKDNESFEICGVFHDVKYVKDKLDRYAEGARNSNNVTSVERKNGLDVMEVTIHGENVIVKYTATVKTVI